MMKRTTWQIWLVLAAFALTVVHLLPTFIYYTKPLGRGIDARQAEEIAQSAVARAQNLEAQTLQWITDLCARLDATSASVRWDAKDPQFIHIRCQNTEQAEVLRAFLSRAGANVPFDAAKLALVPPDRNDDPLDITLVRQIRYHLSPDQVGQALKFVEKSEQPHSLYVRHAQARVFALKQAISLEHPLQVLIERGNAQSLSLASQVQLAEEISPLLREMQQQTALTQRFWWWLFHRVSNRPMAFEKMRDQLEEISENVRTELRALEKHRAEANARDELLTGDQLQQLSALQLRGQTLDAMAQQIRNLDGATLFADFPENLESHAVIHPLIAQLIWKQREGRVEAPLHRDLMRNADEEIPHEGWLLREVSRIGEWTGESLNLTGGEINASLDPSADFPSTLSLDLGMLAQQEVAQITTALKTHWQPEHSELISDNFPIVDASTYQKSPLLAQQFCLVVVAPCLETAPFRGLKGNAVYVIAKNLHQLQKGVANGEESKRALFQRDVESLSRVLGMRGYLFDEHGADRDALLRNSCVFELPDFGRHYLEATRESFQVLGQQRIARLVLGSQKQRLREINRIENSVHEDLLRWRDEYRQARVALDPREQFQVPAPPSSAHWENIKLSWRKYWRGDPDRILKWGLDLSGGKCVRIGLSDARGRQITGKAELEQAREELHARVNALGVSEVVIRIDGAHLTLDFPGSQDISAAELVRASTMRFHVVNEKFSPDHPAHGALVNAFLKRVWDEAQVTGKKDLASLNALARRHLLYCDDREGIEGNASDIASQLRQLGLKLAEEGDLPSAALDETRSMVAPFRGEDFRDWYRQSHPLIIVFKNFALEGADLEDIQARFDATVGNALHFSVKKRMRSDQSSPRQTFSEWTQQFAKDQIVGTPREVDRPDHGWRMAVLLQSSIVSAPELKMPLHDHASISGHFSQREVQRLATDLKAGSLTYQPEILSEENISPQLGLRDRTRGIASAIAGFCGVLAVMGVTYRLAGLVTGVALGFNLLIIWAVLQEMGAAITLPGIAGIVLTMGMAVDANVLIFERIREELQTLSPAKALKEGFKRALPAILDSNITTILAALILIQFDLGPIKGFAVTLIVGLVSSMFTAVFATQAFFQVWVAAGGGLGSSLHQRWREYKIDSLKSFRAALWLSALLVGVGSLAAWQQRHSLLSMEFTGGYSLTLEVMPAKGIHTKERVAQALTDSGLQFGQFRIRQLDTPEHLRIDLSSGLEAPGGPFEKPPVATASNDRLFYKDQIDPRLNWVVDTLERGHVRLTQESLRNLPNLWSATSSQFSLAMRTRALAGLACALVLSLLYLTVRFNGSYAIAAISALAHTLILTLSIASLLHAMQLPIELNLYVLGAFMTIIGYCLNDMIIVFDRIREERRLHARRSLKQTIALAIDRTLTRTLLTCGTTLIALIFLIAFGGESLFAFSTVMAVGVLMGTLSSIFIAAPLLLRLEERARGNAR